MSRSVYYCHNPILHPFFNPNVNEPEENGSNVIIIVEIKLVGFSSLLHP